MADDVEKGTEQQEPEVSQAEGAKPVTEPAAEATPAPEEELAKAKAKADEYLDNWRRTAADFSNYRKRMEREREEMGRFANAMLLTKLLPVLDDLERAMATLPVDLGRLSWVEGVTLIQRKIEYILESEGLKRLEAAGQPFDPERHEAVLREETTAYSDGQVIADLQCGYELHGRILRPALVKVAVAPFGAAALQATASENKETDEEPMPSGPEQSDEKDA